MASLTDEQVEYIEADIRARGIRLQGLQDNLLDHICILVEQGLGQGGDFDSLYAAILPAFYTHELAELEQEALFLASLKGPRLLLSRNRLFALSLLGVLSPFLAYIAHWWLILRPAGDIRQPMDVLGGALVFALFPVLITLVLFLTPERFDPLIPWRSKVLLGGGSLIRILPG
jgi:hypothetical protein